MNDHTHGASTFALNWLALNNVDLNLEADSELEAIWVLLKMVKQYHPEENIKQISQDLLRHEENTPSAHGCCSIVFRVLSEFVEKPEIFLGRFKNGIGYVSKTGKPIDILVLVVAPPAMQHAFKQVVSRLEQALCTVEVNDRLRAAHNADAVLRIFATHVFSPGS